MNELTDLQLCKRIAEIEGLDEKILAALAKHQENRAAFERYNVASISNPYAIQKDVIDVYNPLTNKALLFDLMVKYKVEIDYLRPGDCTIFDSDNLESTVIMIGDSLPRAILTAIVEDNTQQITRNKNESGN